MKRLLPALLAFGCASATPALRSRGAGYSLPVPAGFVQVQKGQTPYDRVLEAGGIVLVRDRRIADLFLGSIVITPVPAKELQPDDPEFCREVGRGMSAVVQADLKRSEIVSMPWGRTCQMELTGGADGPNRGSRGTLLRAGSAYWMVTCNYDVRDDAAQKGCDEVLAGVRDEI